MTKDNKHRILGECKMEDYCANCDTYRSSCGCQPKAIPRVVKLEVDLAKFKAQYFRNFKPKKVKLK